MRRRLLALVLVGAACGGKGGGGHPDGAAGAGGGGHPGGAAGAGGQPGGGSGGSAGGSGSGSGGAGSGGAAAGSGVAGQDGGASDTAGAGAGAKGSDAKTDGASADLKPASDAPVETVKPSDAGLPAKGLLAMYWGQNGYGATHPDKATWEKPLGETCTSHPEYDIVILSFATKLAHTRNQQPFVPETNFANHCEIPYDTANPFLLKCDEMAAGIRTCQAAGKRVLISIGGATGSAGFVDDSDGQMAAQSVWDVLLGGTSAIRPFTDVILDGVDLDIEGGGTIGYSAFVKALRPLMDKSGRKYFITGAPQCPYPDAYLGPAAGRALGDAASAFDFLFVQFYNNYCGYGTPQAFRDTFTQWKTLATGGPKILVGLPATTSAAGSGFVPRATLPSLVNDVKADPAFAGIMLWDVSNDQNSVESGTTYGAYAKTLLR
jgi:chitinase